jgi:cobalt-zinc-cadmium efflux system outer membrane protein
VCRFIFCIFVLNFLASGCSKIPPTDDHFVACTVANRIGSKTEWRQGCYQDVQTLAFIEGAVANELTAEIAIQIALLNNPKIQATLEELGIGQADLLEAGLLSNPSFEIEIRYPHSSSLHTNIEYTSCQ